MENVALAGFAMNLNFEVMSERGRSRGEMRGALRQGWSWPVPLCQTLFDTPVQPEKPLNGCAAGTPYPLKCLMFLTSRLPPYHSSHFVNFDVNFVVVRQKSIDIPDDCAMEMMTSFSYLRLSFGDLLLR